MEKKRNPDYSASAVNLANPPDALNYLKNLRSFKAELSEVQTAIDKATPTELKERKATLEKDIDNILGGIKVVIDTQGSYQDLEKGDYAVKQRKVSISYDPQVFRTQYPSYAPAVIKEIVDTPKLNGLIKGGLVSQEDLKKKGVSSETESFAYIIRTEE